MNENNSKSGLFLLGLMLAIGLVVSAMLISGTMRSIKASDSFITVKGYAEKAIRSDLGSWTCQITVRGNDLASAYTKLERDLAIAKKYILQKGIDPNRLGVKSVNTNKLFAVDNEGRRLGTVAQYELVQPIYASSNNVDLIKSLADDITVLIREGLEVVSYQPEYYVTKINDYKIEMLGEATKDAKNRARQMAENSGSKVGSLKSASQGVFQITPINSVDVSDYGSNDVSSIQKSIKAVVTVDFLIK